MGRKILIAFDASDNSRKAFDFCLKNLFKEGDTFLLAHVSTPPHLSTFAWDNPMSLPVVDWQKKMQEQVKETEKLTGLYESLCEEHKIAKKTLTATGSPGEKICEFAEKEEADFIVMGSRGLNALRRTFTGSVSDYVLHHSHIPVTVVPHK